MIDKVWSYRYLTLSLPCENGFMKKKKQFVTEPPLIDNINEANLFIRELWQKLREYEDRLMLSSRHSSKSPSSDSPADKGRAKKA
ncbi:protein of unknown function [Shewanella benthica]|uniref:DUF6444 domain-containing protein n=1 Tax=Shewanella benthica TaxID=43661 RepID=A0A330M2C5_9GAMM|nr:protein of unknown function [Shewanella benthica]